MFKTRRGRSRLHACPGRRNLENHPVCLIDEVDGALLDTMSEEAHAPFLLNDCLVLELLGDSLPNNSLCSKGNQEA